MLKIKKLIAIMGLFFSLSLFLPASTALADQSTNQSSPPDSTSAANACKKVADATDPHAPTCNQCHPVDQNGNPKTAPKLCVCYPQYYYGSALGSSELSSCKACNQPGLSYDAQTQSCLTSNGVVKVLNMLVNLLAGIAGIVIIAVLIAGGIRYSMAGNPQAAANARKSIINGIIALVAFLLIWAGLHWLIVSGF